MSEQTADGQLLTDQDSPDQDVQSQDGAGDSVGADNVRPMSRAQKKVAAAVGDAREKFQHVAADVGERFQQASSVAQERSQKAREAAREKYQVTSARMQDGYTRARRDVDFMVEDVNDFVREKPGTSVLIAAGAGFLLGLLFRPRR